MEQIARRKFVKSQIFKLSLFLLARQIIVVAKASAELADSPWPMYKGNPQHTGLSPYGTSQVKPVEKWHYIRDGGVESSVAIGADGTLYVGGYHNNLYSLTPEGKEKWRFTDPRGWFRSSPAIAKDGTIYIGALSMGKDHNLYALNPDGTEKWRFQTGGGIVANPTIDKDGTIYFGSWDKKVYAIGQPKNTKKGRTLGEAKTESKDRNGNVKIVKY